MTTCPGCGLVHPDLGLDPPVDLDATGECAREFGSVSEYFYRVPELVPMRQYVVDGYACQHPSVATRRAVQTTALCLMTLDLVVEAGLGVELGPRLHKLMMERHPDVFFALPRPDLAGTLTHRHLAVDPARLADRAREWAESVWHAWREQHAQVRAWNRLIVPQWTP